MIRDAVFQLFRARGVERIYGNPGSTELTLLAGLPDDLTYVLCLHEHTAVAAAAGEAFLSSRPAVVNLHTLAGVGNGVGAIAAAAGNRAPIVVTAGQQDTRHLRTDPLLSGPMVELAAPLVKWSHQPVRPDDVPVALERAFRIAMTPPRGPAFVALPMDFLEANAAAPVEIADPVAAGRLPSAVVEALANDLAAARAPLLVTGAEVETSGGWEAAIELADRIDARVYAAPLAATFGFPTGHPRFAGQLLAEARGLHRAMEGHDLVLFLGGPGVVLYPYTDHPVVPDGARAVLVTEAPDDAAKFEWGRAHVAQVGATVTDLLDALPGDAALTPAPAAEADETGVHPTELGVPAVCQAIRAELGGAFTLVDESVSSGPVLRKHLPVERPNRYLRSSTGGLGSALPAAIGAAFQDPSEPVVVMIGDGSVMYSPQALWTMAQHQQHVIVCVLNNARYQILQDFHASSFTHLGAMVESDLPGLDFATIAGGMGVPGSRVTDIDELRAAVKEAVNLCGPSVLDIRLAAANPSMFE
jgi:benzoylformate decarboxylase